MTMETFPVQLDTRVVPLIAKRKRDVPATLRELAVVELFREARVSSGKAAEVLGMERLEFLALLHRLRVPFFDQDPEELQHDVANA